MLNAVLDGASDAPISVLARLKLTSELTALLKEQAVIQPGAPMAALKSAKVASQIIVVLGKLGVDLEAGRRAASAFQLEGGPEPVAQPRVSTAHFFDYDPNRKSSQRRKDNAEAIALLRRIDAGEIPAEGLSEEQKQALAKYSGTGGNLIGADGLKGSAYEYYTPKPIAAGMWGLLSEMGFAGGKVLDPCSGVGVFGGTAPLNAAIEAVELSEVSGRINQLVNGGPGYNAIVSPFEAVASRTADEQYDAVISNVPFGGVHDRGANRKLDDRYQDDALETYFILRSLEKLKPGGLAAFIVPPRIVSGKGGREEKLRIAMSYKAEFMGAYRLPNSVFGAADADTITDVIVLRKFGRDAAEKVAELKEQSPEVLTKANVLWTEFIAGNYFMGDGRRFVLGEFQAKDPSKFRDVDRVLSNASPAEIGKLLRKFPGSRIDWALLNASETSPILYAEGDTMVSAGQTLEMRNGVWVALPKAAEDSSFDGLGQTLSSALSAAQQSATWEQAGQFVAHLQRTGKELDMPDWLRAAHADVGKVDRAQQAGYWNTLLTGLAVVQVSQAHGSEVGFNFDAQYPFLSQGMRQNAATAKKGFAKFTAGSKAALKKIGVMYDRRSGFSPVWTGDVAVDVMEGITLDTEAQVDAFKYRAQTNRIPVEELRSIYGADFDPLADDGWCVVDGGAAAMRADDFYVGNLGVLLARLDAEIGQATGAVRDKLLRQKALASERVDVINPETLRYNLFSPFVTLEEKAEFLRRFMHPAFVVGLDEDGDKVIICDIKSPSNERERQLKRFAEYLKRGTLSTRTSKDEALANPALEDMRRNMLRDMAQAASAQFDQWVKAHPLIMDRLHQTVNDPARLYFREVDDESPLQIPGLHPDFSAHGYQAGYARKQGRQFGGINGFGVGLGKTATAAAAVLYVQSIGVKKKTIFVLPNSVLSKWRVELVTGRGAKGQQGYKPPVFASGDHCLWVGLDVLEDGSVKMDSGNYNRDFTRILENRHRMIFCTMEAFKAIPLKDETIEAYEAHMRRVDPAYTGSDKKAETERAESKLSEVTSGTGQKSSAIPFFEDMGIDSIVIDEGHCFPAGTLVDGTPIEKLVIGDMVTSFNHATGKIELKRVTDIMSRPAPDMVRVHLSNGQSIVCTHDHPFFSESRGYVGAEYLNECDVIYVKHSRDDKSIHVRAMPNGIPAEQDAGVEVSQGAGQGLLLRQVVCDGAQAHALTEDGCLEGQRGHEGCSSRCIEGQGELAANAGCDREEQAGQTVQWSWQGDCSEDSGRQWAADAEAAADAGGCLALASRVSREDEHGAQQRVPVLLQSGLGEPSSQTGPGGRREVPLFASQAGAGCEEDGILVRVGVDRIEVLERAGDDEFGGLCPGGLVYDITVDGNHNFFAEGILVHNCFKNSKETVDFSGAKFLSVSEASQRGKDAQIKAWFVREGEGGDPPLVLTATPVTNSPLEIYSMMCLAAGEDKVHALTMGAKGADAFMEVMCDIEEDEELGIDGVPRTMRVFRGLQNVNLLRGLLHTVATIKTAKDVGGTIHVPEAPENQVRVQLTPRSKSLLELYRLAYQGARESMKTSGMPTDAQIEAMQTVATKFGEPISLIAHPFNLINKMTLIIADPELDDRATYYLISEADRDAARKVCEQFNKKSRTEWRRAPGPLTRPEAVGKPKVTRDGEAEVALLPCRIEAHVLADGRIAVDTMDTTVQTEFETMAEKAGIDLDCTVPPKLAALLENVRTEEGNPRGTGRVKQLIFCDILPMHNKIRRVLSKRAGIPANQITIISGKTIKSADEIQEVQDGFNAEGEGAKYRTVIANEKAEVGIDLQVGTQAIHHFTIGWTPDATTQRNGRGARQGNRMERVNVYFYDADGTFDQYKRTLTTKKADWINDVMSPDGGNDVQVAGGLTNEQYDELIQSMGDEKAIAAIQERAALRERQARADTARARQVINLRTAAAQADFVKAFKKPEDWAKSKVMALYDLRLTLQGMKSRADGGKMKADALVKLQVRIAELEAKVSGMVREIDASVTIKSGGYNVSTRNGIMGVLNSETHYSNASKVREAIENRVIAHVEVVEGSDLDMEWQQEVASAERMQEEAMKDFARLASQDGTLPAQLIAAQRAGDVAVYSGQVLAKGMFVRLKDSRLCVMDAPDRIVRYPKGLVITPADAMTAGAEFIMFGSPAYEAALNEAAEFDDGADGVTPANVAYLFGSVVPEVAQRRSKPVQVECDRSSVVLGAGPYRYPIDRAADGISPALVALASRQPGVLGWRGDRVIMDASASYKIVHPGYAGASRDSERLTELVSVGKAEGTPFTLVDYVVAAHGASAAKDKFWFVNTTHKLMEAAEWPKAEGGANIFAAATTAKEVNDAADQVVRDAYKRILVLPEDRDPLEFANYKVRYDYDRRLIQIEKQAEVKLMEAEMAAALARKAQEPAEPEPEPDTQDKTPPASLPEPVVPAAAAPAVNETAVQSSPLKLSPWTSKTGEPRVYFNGIPGAGRRETPYGKADAQGFLTLVMPDGLLPVRQTQFTQFIEENLSAMNGGEEVETFARLTQLAGVVQPAPGEVVQDSAGQVGIAGETKPNMGIIKAAAAMAGGRAIWMGKGGKLQWNVPAAAWDIIVQKHPDAAKALYKVPA